LTVVKPFSPAEFKAASELKPAFLHLEKLGFVADQGLVRLLLASAAQAGIPVRRLVAQAWCVPIQIRQMIIGNRYSLVLLCQCRAGLVRNSE
jgi:hypothetical protein